jgi:general stress protein 26
MATHIEELNKFHDLLTRFDTGMLITHGGSNGLHARPMAIAQVEDNCDLWFITSDDSPKSSEIRSNEEVLVTFQNKRDEFITLTGRAELVRDPQKVAEVWKEHFKVWFPDGVNDPNIALIHVSGRQGEYWDNTGLNKASYMVESLRAYFSGTQPNIREGSQHGKLNI